MSQFKIVNDIEIIENDTIHVTILIGEDEFITHIGISKNSDNYNYTIGYIDENLTDKETEYVKNFISEHNKKIFDSVRSLIDSNMI